MSRKARTLLRRTSPALLVLGIWLLYHPYGGVVGDARLYVAQAFHALYPRVFAHDLFFAFGSQDDFTLFTHLFAPLVAWLGPERASITVVAIGQALWLSAAAALALRLAPNRITAVVGLVLVAGMPAFYGGWQVLSYGEGIATPRLLAEALSLWALWCLTCRHPAWAFVLGIAAALLHPLVGATALGAGFVLLVFQDRRWIFLGLAGAAAVTALAVAGVPPLARISRTMDPAWLAVVKQRNIYLFPGLWTTGDWVRVTLATAVSLAGAAILSGWRRHLTLAVTLTGLAGLLTTYIGADVLHNLFVIQVQPFRALWLLNVVAYLAAGVLFTRLGQLSGDSIAMIVLVALTWLAGLTLPLPLLAVLAVAAFGVAILRVRGVLPPLPHLARAVILTLAGYLVVFLVVYRIASVTEMLSTVGGPHALRAIFNPITAVDLGAMAAIVGILWRRAPRLAYAAAPTAALILVVASASAWNRSDEWSRAVAADYPVRAFDELLAPNAQVFWEGDVRGAWLLLHRPSYVSVAQGAGNAFNRQTALLFRDRARAVQPLVPGPLVDYFRDRTPVPPPLPVVTRSTLVSTCRRDRALDAMVLSQGVVGAYVAAWDLPAPFYERGPTAPAIHRVYLYRCADLR